MIDRHALPLSYHADDYDATTTSSHNKHYWLCFHLYKPYKNKVPYGKLKYGKEACIGASQQVTMTCPPLGHVKNICDFTSIFCKSYNNQTYQDVKEACITLTLQMMTTTPLIGHMWSIYVLISNCNSVVTIKLGRIAEHFALVLARRWW